jgi:hypothetical protein
MAQNHQKFRLNASIVASYFKHRCDRLFRWNAVEAGLRQRPGIGWGIPAKIRSSSRPGIQLLMGAGDVFELDNVLRLREEGLAAGVDDLVLMEDVKTEGRRKIIQPLEFDRFSQALRDPIPPRYTAQLKISLAETPEIEQGFLARFGLDPERVRVADTRLDLIETVWRMFPMNRFACEYGISKPASQRATSILCRWPTTPSSLSTCWKPIISIHIRWILAWASSSRVRVGKSLNWILTGWP